MNDTLNKFTFFYSAISPFSNWHPCKFVMNDVEFNCGEQAMMYHKALFFGDKETADKVMAAKTPREQKALGRSVKGFVESDWQQERENIVYDLLLAKFSQNEELKEALLETKGTQLVEASKTDLIYGIGLSEDDPRAQNETQWRGLNLLGKLLMRVRETLST